MANRFAGDPSTPEWQRQNLTWIEPVPGQRWQVYRPAAASFDGLLRELAVSGYAPTSSGGFNYRNIRGSNKLSQHAYGAAIDINAATNPLGQATSDIPNAAALAAKYGLEWGGNWRNRPDPMHFEYRGPRATSDFAGGVATGFVKPAHSPEQAADQSSQGPQSWPVGVSPAAAAGDSGGLLAPPGQENWMANTSYSPSSIASDIFQGRSPLRRFVFQKIMGLFA